jgi:predicted nucleic acid-binding protein
MGAVTFDTSVLIGFLRPEDAHHDAAKRLLVAHAANAKLVPAVVYTEVLVRAIRAGREDEIDEFLEDLAAEIVPYDRVTARRAADLRARHASLRTPDAMALATAQIHGAPLITFDKRLARLT